MRRLPELVAADGRRALPMSDRSAALLAELLLAEDRAELAESLSEQLAEDPPLVLWAVCRAAADQPAWQPGSVAAVARWLARHAVTVLRWQEGDSGDAGPDAWGAEACAALVEADLARADLAALLAEPAGQAQADEVFLRAILAGADGWLSLGADGPAPASVGFLPPWLARPEDTPAARWVGQAAAALSGGGEGVPPAVDLEDCLQRAAEASRRWAEDVPGAGAALAALCARLARLEELEARFAEDLERAKLDAMAEFAAGAGHEINNPLAVIAGRAQLFLRDETDAERRRGLALIVAQVKRAYEMIADMRLFARPPAPEFRRFDLAALLDGLVAEFAPAAARQAIQITRPGHAGPLEIEADAAQVQVAVRAVVQNALEAIGREGHVEVALHAAGDEVRVRVADDGPGIGPEERKHLFDPFYSARQAGRGLGLGLSKAWRIVVTNHRGRIEVQSGPARGAALTITLPR